MAVTEQTLTVEEFLKLPETEPASELWYGRAVQKVAPQGIHARLQGKLYELSNAFGEPRQLAMAFTELRAVFGPRVYVPDLSIYRWERVRYTEDGEIANDQGPPDVAIEIASPGQSEGDLFEKCLEYVANGTEIALLIIPERRVIFRFGTGGTTRVLRGGDQIDLTTVLPGFELTVDQVFALIRRPSPRP
jgi:Uma2 family endonuclease